MSYNFDPDRWYERERLRLDRRRESGDIDEAEHERLVQALDRRLEDIVSRLDHTFQLPARRG